MAQRDEDKLSYEIIGTAIEVPRTLGGPGLLEAIYESALCHELMLRNFHIQKQLCIPVKYKNTVVRNSLCLDILVENTVIIEVKATEKEHDIHKAQLLTYLRLTELKLGLLINFGQTCVKDGIHRVVNGL
ncbi:MAG: GxxExxY protein [Chlamydiales bacterium]